MISRERKRDGPKLKHYLEQACEKGASTWLTALLLKSLNYVLNKQDLQDGICLRYGWVIESTPKICAGGEKNSSYHALDYKLGGYVSMRHNSVRDTVAFFWRKQSVEMSELNDACPL